MVALDSKIQEKKIMWQWQNGQIGIVTDDTPLKKLKK
jgi:hypothetical protein